MPTEEKLNLLRSVLQSPLFHQILALQKSVQHLRDQVNTGVTGAPPTSQQPLASQFSLLAVSSIPLHHTNVVNSISVREIVCITCVLPPKTPAPTCRGADITQAPSSPHRLPPPTPRVASGCYGHISSRVEISQTGVGGRGSFAQSHLEWILFTAENMRKGKKRALERI